MFFKGLVEEQGEAADDVRGLGELTPLKNSSDAVLATIGREEASAIVGE